MPTASVRSHVGLDPSRLYALRTAHGTTLLHNAVAGLHHGWPGAEPTVRVLAWLPAERPDICLLVAEDGRSLRLVDDSDAAVVVSLRAHRVDDAAWWLVHPVTGFLACAEPLVGNGGRFCANRAQAGLWERFEPQVVSDVSATLLAALRPVQTLLAALASPAAAMATVVAVAPDDAPALRQVLRLLGPEDADWLGRHLRRDPVACAAFGAVYPDDLWATHALPSLHTAADLVHVRQIGTAFDTLAGNDLDGRHRSFAQLCNIFARRDHTPTRTLCLVATARNEGTYLLEWLAYHRRLGVEAFLIYSNDNTDGSDDLLHALATEGVITWIDNVTAAGGNPQFKAYAHAMQIAPDILDFHWAGIIDLDEFVGLNAARYASIPALLAARSVEPVDAVMLNWLQFGSSGQLTREEKPVLERFQTREAAVNPHVKTFFRPHRFLHAMPHHPFADRTVHPVCRSASGVLHPLGPFSPQPEDGHAWIAHYYAKSAEEYILRRSMHKADALGTTAVSPSLFGHAAAAGFVTQHGQPGVHDVRTARHSAALVEETARLAALPGVAAALERIGQLYRTRLQALVHAMPGDPRYTTADTPEHWFAEALMTESSPYRDTAP